MRKKEKPIEVHYDPSSDVLYVVTQEGEEEEFIEVSPGVPVSKGTQRKSKQGKARKLGIQLPIVRFHIAVNC